MKLYIKDLERGTFHEIGTNPHDCLKLDENGSLYYYNLQCGESSRCGTYAFCDANGNVPSKNSVNYINTRELIYSYGAKTCIFENLGNNDVYCMILHFFEEDEVTYQDKPEGVFKCPDSEKECFEDMESMMEMWDLFDSTHDNFRMVKEDKHWIVYATTVATGIERRYARWDFEYR